MATGSGKTRTAMGLVDLFLRTSWAQKILFVADRDALVEQALNDGFKAHLPHEPRVRVHTANLDTGKRLYVATLQTMARCFEQFSPGFFDLVIFDEAHRSIFNRFNEVIEYFDARMIGLTATPSIARARSWRRPSPTGTPSAGSGRKSWTSASRTAGGICRARPSCSP
jgi:type I restriction enzyme R subunit